MGIDTDLESTPHLAAARESALLSVRKRFDGTVETNPELKAAVDIVLKLLQCVNSTRVRAKNIGTDATMLLDGIFDRESEPENVGFQAGINALLPNVEQQEGLFNGNPGEYFPTIIAGVRLFRQKTGGIGIVASKSPVPKVQ